MQYHHLDGDPRAEPQHDAPPAVKLKHVAFPQALITISAAAPPSLVQNEDDRHAVHVTVLAQNMPGGRQLPGLQGECSLAAVQDSKF